MAWVAVDKNGHEFIFAGRPTRAVFYWNEDSFWDEVELPQGSIKKLIGRDLTWEDDPVELKNEE